MHKLIPFFKFLLLFYLIVFFRTNCPAEIKLLESTTSGCQLELILNQFTIDTMRINSRYYHRIQTKDGYAFGKPGDPDLPCYTCLVGIPAEGNVNVSLMDYSVQKKENVNAMPIPESIHEGKFSKLHYFEGERYQADQVFPDEIYQAEPPGFMGHQRIVRLSIYPFQYLPKSKTIKFYSKVKIQIDFEKPAISNGASIIHKKLNDYSNPIINYQQTLNWQKPLFKSTQKTSRTQTGEWYKIPISGTDEGIYQIKGSWLDDNGIDISSIDPSTLKIYNHGGQMLSESLSDIPEEGWIENPIYVSDGSDGSFNSGDYLLFYGRGTQNTSFQSDGSLQHYTHLYSNENIYFLVFNDGIEGKRIEPATTQVSGSVTSINSFRDLIFYEEDEVNLVVGGKSWVGYTFTPGVPDLTLTLPFANGLSESDATFYFRFYGATNEYHNFQIYINSTLLNSFSRRTKNYITQQFTYSGLDLNGDRDITIKYTSSADNAKAYLDWIRVSYERELKAVDNELKFFSPETVGNYELNLSGFTSQPTIWDISDISQIQSISLSSSNDGYVFSTTVDETPKTFYAFTAGNYKTPSQITPDETSSLRNTSNGADYLIISHSDFMEAAQILKSHRESHDGFSVYIADIQNVFDEFGNGVTDPSAIRYFLNYVLTQWRTAPQYVLLLGDGHFDYRNILSTSGKNFIIPYEYSGLSESGSRATDDFYTYAVGSDTQMDISIGRINCTTSDEAETYIQKLIQYETEPLYGLWKKIVTIVGDDEVTSDATNETTHTRDAEIIAQNYIPKYFDLKKVYLMEYPLEKSVGYDSKPKANEALMDQLNLGTVLVNYLGHGNETLWAHESVFEKSRDLSLLYNARKLPLYYAATCAFGLYDNPEEQSFSEELILADSTGGIAVIASSRFCNPRKNASLNKGFLNQLFSVESGTMPLGEALRTAKNKMSGSRANNEMYHLFGDPAMKLAVPSMKAKITYTDPDSFKALSVFQVQGNVKEQNSFKGNLILNAYDSYKDITYTTKSNTPVNYILPGNAIFRGEGTISDNQFDLSFVVPKDISYAGVTGRLSLYFWNELGDGFAYQDSIPVGGSANIVDTGEPDIEIAFEGYDTFMSGDMIEEDPILTAVISDDKTGVNLTGEIGHTLLLTLDGSTEKDITEYFQYDENSYLQGKVVYPMQNLDEGEHTLKLKAWDNANNSGSQTVTFQIVPKGKLKLTDVLNYPNPFQNQTQFTFNLSHSAEIQIKIFTVSGRLIRKLDYIQGESGFNMIHWDGRDELGDALANGVYLFKVYAKTELDGETQKTSKIGRALHVN